MQNLAQLGQADFQVPDQPDFDGIVLADLPRVLIDMHDFYMFGNCARRLEVNVQPQQVHADDQDDVMIGQPGANLGRPDRQARRGKWMIGRKAQAPVRGARFGNHGRADPLGDGHQFGHGVGLGRAAADQDRWVARRAEHFCRFAQGGNGRAHARVERFGLGQIEFGDLALQIHRQRQKHRTRGRRQGRLGGAANGGGKILHAVDLGGPFHPRLGHADHVGPQDRLFEHQPTILLPGRDQEGRARAMGVVEHAHRVPQPATDVQVDDAERSRGLGVAVGHGDDGDLLQAEDVLDASILDHGIRKGQLGRAGVAEQILHAETGEHVEKGLYAADSH